MATAEYTESSATRRGVSPPAAQGKPEIAVGESSVREYVSLNKTEVGLTGREL